MDETISFVGLDDSDTSWSIVALILSGLIALIQSGSMALVLFVFGNSEVLELSGSGLSQALWLRFCQAWKAWISVSLQRVVAGNQAQTRAHAHNLLKADHGSLKKRKTRQGKWQNLNGLAWRAKCVN
jgi:hypothetical protein